MLQVLASQFFRYEGWQVFMQQQALQRELSASAGKGIQTMCFLSIWHPGSMLSEDQPGSLLATMLHLWYTTAQ